VELADSLPPVLADELYLGQVLANLLENAIRHGGEAIRVRASEGAGGFVEISVEEIVRRADAELEAEHPECEHRRGRRSAAGDECDGQHERRVEERRKGVDDAQGAQPAAHLAGSRGALDVDDLFEVRDQIFDQPAARVRKQGTRPGHEVME